MVPSSLPCSLCNGSELREEDLLLLLGNPSATPPYVATTMGAGLDQQSGRQNSKAEAFLKWKVVVM